MGDSHFLYVLCSMFNFLYAYIKLSNIFGYLYICGFNFTLCTLSFYIDLIKLKFEPVENRCVYTNHLQIFIMLHIS